MAKLGMDLGLSKKNNISNLKNLIDSERLGVSEIEDQIKLAEGLPNALNLPELGQSSKFGQVRDFNLMDESSSNLDSTDYSAVAGVAPKAAAELLTGIYKANLIREKAKRDAEAKALSETGIGKFESLSKTSEAQINPLKSLIANYRAAIR